MSRLFFLVFFFFFVLPFANSLGITPALKTIDFFPNTNVNLTFTAISEDPNGILDISIGGDLAPYAVSSAKTVTGSSSFIISLQFPEIMPEPGRHTITVSLKERPSESAFIGTSVEIGAVINVFIPYPGLYGELSLSIPDSNLGDKFPVELYVINRGEENLNISRVVVDFFDNENTIFHSMNFTPIIISAPGDRYFRKYIDDVLKAGNYLARARINYSNIIREVNETFRVGSLNIKIVNFTDTLPAGGIQKFYVTLESSWNSLFVGVYVDVNITNLLGESISFRTSSIDIGPWEQKTIESYIDTEKLKGIYTMQLKSVYPGSNESVSAVLTIVPKNIIIPYVIIAGILLLVILFIYLVARHFRISRI